MTGTSRFTGRYRAIGAALAALIAFAGSAAGLVTVAAVPASAAEGTLTVWVSPLGSDLNDGLSAGAPFQTLQRASDWLCSGGPACPGRGQPVVVRLAQTTWKDVPTTKTVKSWTINTGEGKAVQATTATSWHYYDPAFTTTFQPWNYEPGDSWAEVSAGGGYPTFDGGFANDSGLVFTPLTAAKGRSTGLNFVYIRWMHYRRSAVALSGGLQQVLQNGVTMWAPTDLTAGGVTFFGNYFYQIGNWWHPENALAFGAILANNSAGNVYRNNHFKQLRNQLANQDSIHVHALYISHWSDNGLVEGNEFTDITGDPVRQRDRTYGTVTRGNTFTKAGAYAYVDDYYCRPNTPASYCAPKEYRSYTGTFSGNTLNGMWPQGISGRRTAYCFDLTGGLCPADRIKVTS